MLLLNTNYSPQLLRAIKKSPGVSFQGILRGLQSVTNESKDRRFI